MPVLSLSRPYTHLSESSMYAGFSLSQEEVRGLMGDKSAAMLVAVTQKIAGSYGRQELQDIDAQAAEQIFRLLVCETEIQVRQTLAVHIKNSTTIPIDIVMTLAKDVAEVSLPILQYSQVLTDGDLLELIEHSEDIDRYLAISRRARLSERVSGTLLDTNNDEVAIALMNNQGVAIAEAKLSSLIAKKPENTPLMRAISRRPRLPMTVAEKLFQVISTNIADSPKEKHGMSGEQIEIEVEKTRESETLKLIREARSQEDIDRLVRQLVGFNRLSPSLILASLCQGNFRFFETSLARLSDIPVANANTLINDRGNLGFRAIYNKSGLPEALFSAVRLLLTTIQTLDEQGKKPESPGYADRVVDDILKQSAGKKIDNLSYIIALVRRTVH